MARLEELAPGALVRGLFRDRQVRVVAVNWHGSSALTLTYTDELSGRPGQELLDRSDEPRLTVEQASRSWPMDGDPRLFRLASEAKRISLAYLFDPFLAVQTSNLQPLPHQVDAVYNKMLPLCPLRFLLADDPGAGKTIMAGLLIKELRIRGDVERCLVIAPGSLVEQWQDELWQKFAMDFKILTRDMIETSGTGNPFEEQPLLIARLDHWPSPVSTAGQGYDVESRTAAGVHRFILVRQRDPGTGNFTVTGTELGVARNTVGRHVLALVDGGRPRYLPDGLAAVADPPFDSAVITLPWQAFFGRGEEPR